MLPSNYAFSVDLYLLCILSQLIADRFQKTSILALDTFVTSKSGVIYCKVAVQAWLSHLFR